MSKCKKKETAIEKASNDIASIQTKDKPFMAKVMFGSYNGISKGDFIYVSEQELKQNPTQLLFIKN